MYYKYLKVPAQNIPPNNQTFYSTRKEGSIIVSLLLAPTGQCLSIITAVYS